MSKAYGLPGLRIGWLACRDRALLERLERRKQIALGAADRILARNRAIITENLPAFDAFFAAWPEHFAWEPPQGGCVTFPRLLTGEPTGTFCRRLVETAGVLLLPADIYHSDLAEMPSDRFRLGVGRRDPLPALDALDRFLHTDR